MSNLSPAKLEILVEAKKQGQELTMPKALELLGLKSQGVAKKYIDAANSVSYETAEEIFEVVPDCTQECPEDEESFEPAFDPFEKKETPDADYFEYLLVDSGGKIKNLELFKVSGSRVTLKEKVVERALSDYDDSEKHPSLPITMGQFRKQMQNYK